MNALGLMAALSLVLLCSCESADKGVGVVDTHAPTPLQFEIPEGFPPMAIPVDNPMTVEGVELGRKLFFDPILSIDSTKSCASCHLPQFSFADPMRFSEGVGGFTQRHSMPLVNVGWAPSLFWDGRSASLEEQAVQPVQQAVEMGEEWDHVVEKLARNPDYPRLFEMAFGNRPVTRDLAVKAIAQFERTLISSNSKYDRFLAGGAELSPREQLGFELFNNETGDCFHCHGTILFTDNQFHNNGIDIAPPDSGLAAITGRVFDLGKFKSPTLRNIEYTAPYMHDGRFATLEEVVEFYSSGIRKSALTDPLLRARRHTLTPEQQEALVAFLKTLSDPGFLQSIDP